jgi:hypothetical protein
MTALARKLLDEVLRLPLEERASVAAELLVSLDEPLESPAEVETAWAAEIEQRAQGVLTGQATGQSWSAVRHELEGHFVKR